MKTAGFIPKDMALKGDFIYTETPERLKAAPNSYLVCVNGKVEGVFPQLPEAYRALPLHDYSGCVIVPGLVDLHLHAPQYANRGIGMDMELLDWLNTYTFPEEAKYGDLTYAEQAYRKFAEDLKNSATTRAAVFGTIHTEATRLLMELLEETGVKAMVGKVNMDRNSPPELCEITERSVEDTERWICECKGRYRNVAPIITPRFVPSCTDELLNALGRLADRYDLPVQSHLSENRSEIAWVKELCPGTSCYGGAYNRWELFGQRPTVMAHCVHSTDEELELMRVNGVYAAHCAQSNMNLSSGIAPVKRMLQMGVNVGLGTDIAGGACLSVFRAASDAIQASKLRWAVVDGAYTALTVPEAFYLATKGGGSFWGRVGSFEEGYEFDAVVLDDSGFGGGPLALEQRLERILYLSDDRNIVAKYVFGEKTLDRGNP